MGKIIKRQIRSHDAPGGLIEFEIKSLTVADIPAIIRIAKVSFEKVWTREEFEYFILHSSGFCFGIFFQGVLISYLLSLLVLGEVDVVSIAVIPEKRRQRFGEVFLEFLWESPEIRRIFLEVEADNIPALALYKKAGFEQYGLRRKYYEGKKDAILMKREKR